MTPVPMTMLATLCVAIALLPAAEARADRCFGAAGMQCGVFSSGALTQVAFCFALNFNPRTTFCEVSGGSWAHDTCCAANPNGVHCGGNDSRSACQVSWDRAVHRAFWGYHWARVVDGVRNDTDGQVNRPEYCARRKAGVHRNDTQYCCSGEHRNATTLEWLGRPDVKICR